MDRKFLIAANWKMNPAPAGFDAADSPFRAESAVDVIVLPTFVDLQKAIAAKLSVGGQCGRSEPSGAFTGDVSISQLKALGCRYILCGHSERRRHHGETDKMVAEQAIATLEAGLHPIVCVGETEEERKAGKEKDIVKKQMKGLPADVTIAYEPVWAIGTGKNATPKDAQEMHGFIRSLLPKDQRESTRILYGGSMNAANAEELLKQEDVDGGLIGGASLKPDEFRKIVEAAEGLSK
ncbi:triose-phosphate isomerase [Candidatus Peribacteria bacterium]|nr:triose-phosphate isomerase [Candidatus Peribacteria bacterium]